MTAQDLPELPVRRAAELGAGSWAHSLALRACMGASFKTIRAETEGNLAFS